VKAAGKQRLEWETGPLAVEEEKMVAGRFGFTCKVKKKNRINK
jgi:hypothetical protein